MIKKFLKITALLILLTMAAGCRDNGDEPGSIGSRASSAKPFRVGIVLSLPRPGVQDINSSLLAGAKKAEEQLGIEYKVLNNGDLVDEVESFRYLAENEYDLIIAGGPEMAKNLDSVAVKYKNARFAIVGKMLDRDNVTSLIFNEAQGGFLAGATAAMLTNTNVVGFIGGSQLDEEAVGLQGGFLKGVQYINNLEGRQIKSYVSYAGVFADAMLKPDKGKEMAYAQYRNGVDIIFQAAGQTGDGVYQAAAEARRYIMGNSSKQAEKTPGNSYGVTVKQYDSAIYDLIENAYKGKLKGGTVQLGVNNQGIDFVPSGAVPSETVERLKGIKAALVNGSIKLENIAVAKDLELKVPEPGANAPAQSEQGQGWRNTQSGQRGTNGNKSGQTKGSTKSGGPVTPPQGGTAGQGEQEPSQGSQEQTSGESPVDTQPPVEPQPGSPGENANGEGSGVDQVIE